MTTLGVILLCLSAVVVVVALFDSSLSVPWRLYATTANSFAAGLIVATLVS